MSVKYKVVSNEIESEILSGIYNKTKKLPTEDELMKKFDVSRNTIRKAIDILVDLGYVYQVQGSGIFLREFAKPGCVTLNGMKGLTKEFSNEKLKSILIDLALIEADEELSKKMKCSIGTKIYKLKRIRYLNGEPYVIEESYYNKDLVPYLNKEICEESIYRYIENDLKLKIGFADKMIYAEKLNNEDAKLLNLKEGDPALIIENTAFLSTGIIFDISREKYNFKKGKLLSLGKN